MNFDYDAVIIGAGPVGSTISYYLARKGLKIALIDKKKQIGYPLQCAGIVSKHIFEKNELPDDVILNTVKGAFLHTKNHILNVEKTENVAYIIDRIAYDQFLLKQAIKNGAKLINSKLIDVDAEKGISYFSNNKSITSRVIIACDGYNSKVSSTIGNNQKNFPASQMLVSINDKNMKHFRKSNKPINDYVDTYLFEDILPGFLWIIPLKNNQYRIGLFSNQTHKEQNIFLTNFLNENFSYKIIEKYKGFIPIYTNNNQLVKDRVLLIGDAASQVKPTSGGGLLIAFDSCKIACKYITDALEKNDISILTGYQDEFKRKYSKEFNYQFKVQNTLNLLNNKDLDYLFEKLEKHDCERIISQYGDMDNQSKLVKEFIKRGLIFKIIPTFLFKKVVNIFGFR